MNEYTAYDDRQMKVSTRIAAVIAGIALVGASIIIQSIYTGIVGAIILLATSMSKTTVVNDKGLLVTYKFLLFRHEDLWSFDNISDMHKELAEDRQFTIIHFGKGVMAKRIIFYRDDAEKVIKLALEKNSKIHFDEAK